MRPDLPNPIIALWSHPRSMSTATERIMRERGDLTVFHEPFLAYYYKHVSTRHLAFYDESQVALSEFSEIKHALFKAASDAPVFFKDMSYYVTPGILEDHDFTHLLCNVFLIRDPRRSIASFYRLDPELTADELGLDAQWKHFSFLADNSPVVPLVIEAESMAADPAGTMRRVWEYCGLPFTGSAFSWQADATPADWRYVEGWHREAVSSTSITRDTGDPDEVFAQAAKQAPFLRDFLHAQQPFYKKLKSRALSLPG